MKTYSVCIKNKDGVWVTNWGQYPKLDDINFDKVEEFCVKRGDLAYGYMYGNKSRNLTSSKCRTVVKEIEHG